jgi:hypothetical protein
MPSPELGQNHQKLITPNRRSADTLGQILPVGKHPFFEIAEKPVDLGGLSGQVNLPGITGSIDFKKIVGDLNQARTSAEIVQANQASWRLASRVISLVGPLVESSIVSDWIRQDVRLLMQSFYRFNTDSQSVPVYPVSPLLRKAGLSAGVSPAGEYTVSQLNRSPISIPGMDLMIGDVVIKVNTPDPGFLEVPTITEMQERRTLISQTYKKAEKTRVISEYTQISPPIVYSADIFRRNCSEVKVLRNLFASLHLGASSLMKTMFVYPETRDIPYASNTSTSTQVDKRSFVEQSIHRGSKWGHMYTTQEIEDGEHFGQQNVYVQWEHIVKTTTRSKFRNDHSARIAKPVFLPDLVNSGVSPDTFYVMKIKGKDVPVTLADYLMGTLAHSDRQFLECVSQVSARAAEASRFAGNKVKEKHMSDADTAFLQSSIDVLYGNWPVALTLFYKQLREPIVRYLMQAGYNGMANRDIFSADIVELPNNRPSGTIYSN